MLFPKFLILGASASAVASTIPSIDNQQCKIVNLVVTALHKEAKASSFCSSLVPVCTASTTRTIFYTNNVRQTSSKPTTVTSTVTETSTTTSTDLTLVPSTSTAEAVTTTTTDVVTTTSLRCDQQEKRNAPKTSKAPPVPKGCAQAPGLLKIFPCEQLVTACKCLALPTTTKTFTVTQTTQTTVVSTVADVSTTTVTLTQVAIITATPITTVTPTSTSTLVSTTTVVSCPCTSPGLTDLCGTTCVNRQTDPNNCGTCGNTCPSGTCSNGACTSPSLDSCPTASRCNAPVTCPGSTGCYCLKTSSGVNRCVQLSGCASVGCTADADCSAGRYCVVDTCCGGGVCLAYASCPNPGVPSRMFRKRMVGEEMEVDPLDSVSVEEWRAKNGEK
ncbi:hypothetical protein HBH64_013320 [Parastagonospora nodorum]|nr:hypothetical protein HBH51_008790 [Parastagonospora nodorum]KAH4127857.1 hypothetical protein HBH47_037830 [Parastagonospora nodorum]KAH4298788.1 hypothetical protein HBI01_122420 [Parastagonospora nodorum]KAH4313536.1 hypothetical protein HBI02_075890 [Parastagonospora nodorum]KAH4336202.1 hypothetical protein HBI00_029080 [Parastagonospora nodorum]